MDYKIEDVSPVLKKFTVDLSKEEVNGSIIAAVALYSDKVSMSGFRKGKTPSQMIERQYHKHIYAEARQDLINANINSVLADEKIKPIGPLHVDEQSEFKRDTPFHYSFQCEVFPDVTLPNYEGLEVTVKKQVMRPNAVEEAILQTQRKNAKSVPIDGNGPAEDGQIVNMDFSFYLDNHLLQDQSKKNYEAVVTPKNFLPAFYELVKSVHLGEEKEGSVTFPADFLNSELAGKTAQVKVQVNAIKNVVLPEVNDEFAQKLGYTNEADMREKFALSIQTQWEDIEKGRAKELLISQLLKLCDFPVPSYYVRYLYSFFYNSYKEQLELQGYRITDDKKISEAVLPVAQYQARSLVLLLAIAQKENLAVSDKEVQVEIFNEAKNLGLDYNALRQQYERDGTIFLFRDRILSEKATNLIYERAKVTFVDQQDDEKKGSADTEVTEKQEETKVADSKESESEG